MGNDQSVATGKQASHSKSEPPVAKPEYAGVYEQYGGAAPSLHSILKPGSPCAPNSFFTAMANHLDREYIVIVDSSRMLLGGLWKRMTTAVEDIVEGASTMTSNGVTIIFFNHATKVFPNVKQRQFVEDLLGSKEVDLDHGRDLAAALHIAFTEHFRSLKRATSVLVLTVGSPDSRSDAEAVLRKAVASVQNAAELTISLVQLGSDSGASSFFREADDLHARFDLVDTIHADHLRGGDTETFSNFIAQCAREPLEATKTVQSALDERQKAREERSYFPRDDGPKALPQQFHGYQGEKV